MKWILLLLVVLVGCGPSAQDVVKANVEEKTYGVIINSAMSESQSVINALELAGVSIIVEDVDCLNAAEAMQRLTIARVDMIIGGICDDPAYIAEQTNTDYYSVKEYEEDKGFNILYEEEYGVSPDKYAKGANSALTQ